MLQATGKTLYVVQVTLQLAFIRPQQTRLSKALCSALLSQLSNRGEAISFTGVLGQAYQCRRVAAGLSTRVQQRTETEKHGLRQVVIRQHVLMCEGGRLNTVFQSLLQDVQILEHLGVFSGAQPLAGLYHKLLIHRDGAGVEVRPQIHNGRIELGKAQAGGTFGLKLRLGLQYHRGVFIALIHPVLGGRRNEYEAQQNSRYDFIYFVHCWLRS